MRRRQFLLAGVLVLPTMAARDVVGAPATMPCATAAESAGTISREQIRARYADEDSRFVELDGSSVHYKDQGQGPALLLVHGSVGDLGDWDGWVVSLREHYRMIRMDLPSFGLSGDVPSGNYSIDRYLTLVDSLMDHLGVPRFAIAGTSYGGLVAFRYAATRTDRVSALILMNSAGIEYGGRRGTTERPRDSAPVFTPGVATTEEIAKLLNDLINDPDRLTPALVQRKTDFANVIGRDRESFLGIQLYERGDPMRVLARVRAPALVLWGGNSKGLSPETSQAFVDGLRNAPRVEKIIYDGGGHLLHVERPEPTARDARAFLDANVAAKGLVEVPFWARSAGCWQSDNTYLDGAMNYMERAYHSIVEIVLDGRTMRETEYKFLAPGPLAIAYGQGEINAGEGLEVVTRSSGRVVDAEGTVRLTQISPTLAGLADPRVTVLNADTALLSVPGLDGGTDAYRMFITLPTSNTRHVANFGIGPTGGVRGVSVFRGTRFAPEQIERVRSELRRRTMVKGIVEAGLDRKPVVTRLP